MIRKEPGTYLNNLTLAYVITHGIAIRDHVIIRPFSLSYFIYFLFYFNFIFNSSRPASVWGFQDPGTSCSLLSE